MKRKRQFCRVIIKNIFEPIQTFGLFNLIFSKHVKISAFTFFNDGLFQFFTDVKVATLKGKRTYNGINFFNQLFE